jgi:hypothetical protein
LYGTTREMPITWTLGCLPSPSSTTHLPPLKLLPPQKKKRGEGIHHSVDRKLIMACNWPPVFANVDNAVIERCRHDNYENKRIEDRSLDHRFRLPVCAFQLHIQRQCPGQAPTSTPKLAAYNGKVCRQMGACHRPLNPSSLSNAIFRQTATWPPSVHRRCRGSSCACVLRSMCWRA